MGNNAEGKSYMARVTNVNVVSDGVEIAFIYYGSSSGSVHFDTILPSSRRYKKALKVQKGDDVYADPAECDKICHFVINPWYKRLYNRVIKSVYNDLKYAF